MKATDILMDEHRVIERVLGALEIAIQRVGQPGGPGPTFFNDSVEFLKGFADGCHHRKEEDVLFDEMTSAGMPVDGGPIAVMLHEHEQGRSYIAKVREATGRWEQGDDAASREVVNAVRGYVQLLRDHIAKEDQVLFPMAEQVIPVGRQQEVVERFKLVEHDEVGEGVHERYLALAERLEREMGDK